MDKVTVQTEGRDLIAGGVVYYATGDGSVSIPKTVAIEEGYFEEPAEVGGIQSNGLAPTPSLTPIPPAPWEKVK